MSSHYHMLFYTKFLRHFYYKKHVKIVEIRPGGSQKSEKAYIVFLDRGRLLNDIVVFSKYGENMSLLQGFYRGLWPK